MPRPAHHIPLFVAQANPYSQHREIVIATKFALKYRSDGRECLPMFRVRVWDGVSSDFVDVEYEKLPLTDERDFQCTRAVRCRLNVPKAFPVYSVKRFHPLKA